MDQTIYNKIQSNVWEKHTFHMNALRFREITQLVYGKSIEMLGSSNDTTHEYTVEGAGLNGDEKKNLEKAIKYGGLEERNYNLILEDLCQKGYLQPGEYFLRMSW